MPYRKRTNDDGIEVTDSLICNYSPFLIELNNAVGRLELNTGIDEIEILNHFLCNTSIIFHRVKGFIFTDTLNQYFVIQINTNDLTKIKWNEIYDIYRTQNKCICQLKVRSKDHLKLGHSCVN